MIFGSLSPIHLFPWFQTREQVTEKLGFKSGSKELPEYDPNKLVKSWIDTNPPVADDEGNCVYQSIALAPDGRTPLLKNGLPYFTKLRVPSNEVGVFNIPLKGYGILDTPYTKEYRMPMRELKDIEEFYLGFGGLPSVRTKETKVNVSTPVADNSIMESLQNMDAKLELILALLKDRNMKYKELCQIIADAIEKLEYKQNSRAARNNNPGNLWDGNQKRIFPKVPTDNEGFLIYPDYKKGRTALEKDILLKILSGYTLEKYVYSYANPELEITEKYLKIMEELTDIKRSEKLKNLIDA